MNIEYIKGDIFKAGERVIAHGCNAQGVMRSGIAAGIVDNYPQAFNSYRQTYIDQDEFLYLGQVIPSLQTDKTMILNCVTQEYYGREHGRRYVSYDAIVKCIEAINLYSFERVAFPKIGAGLANGKWEVIESIIETYSKFTPVVYIFE